MEAKPHLIPAVAVKSIASGMLMMAIFTLIWAGIASGGLAGSNYQFILIIYPVFSILFVVNAIRLFMAAKHFPKVSTEADREEGKKMGMWFGIIFGAEGLGIFIAVNVVNNLGHPELVIPAIALVVGLHFYPMAKIFKRTLDYYLATWATIVAVTAMVLILNKTITQSTMLAFTGIGLAIATTCYGTYMMLTGWKLSRQVELAPFLKQSNDPA